MIQADTNLSELAGSIVYLRTNCNHSEYPTEFQTYDEAWEELRTSLDHLRFALGEARYHQLVEMVVQAKAHYDTAYEAGFVRSEPVRPTDPGLEEIKLGSWLMQDIEQVVKGKTPFAYPEELYRWPRSNDN